MAKDPAFLFYYQDFLVGIDHMTLEQVGAYIKCLCYQASRGTIRASHMASLVGSQENLDIVAEKFSIDENGELFNERLRFEMEKRKKFTQSRLDNLHKASHKASHMGSHMENENDNENVIKDKVVFNFESLWFIYPNKLGKKEALRHFNATVLTEQDYQNIQKALNNYLNHTKTIEAKFIKHGSSWFNNWSDWINYQIPIESKKWDI